MEQAGVMEIDLDNQTATPPDAQVLEQMAHALKNLWGAPTSLHKRGQEIFPAAAAAMKKIYGTLGLHDGDSLLLCHSQAEALHDLFLSTYLDVSRETGRTHFIAAPFGQPAEREAIKRLEKLGCSSKILEPNGQGQITARILEEAIRPRTVLISIPWVCNKTGVIQPVADLVKVAHEKRILIHIDVSGVIGKMAFHFRDLPIDFMTLDGIHFHAPRGCAALIARGATLPDREVSIASLTALSFALENSHKHFEHLCTETARLRDLLEQLVAEKIDDVEIVFKEAERLPNVTALNFPGTPSEPLLYLLHKQKLYASLYNSTAVSFALSHTTTEEEIRHAAQIVVSSVSHMRGIAGAFQ
jgi:cysteine desulfurase